MVRKIDIDREIEGVLAAETSNFAELVAMTSLRPERDFRYADLSNIDFRGLDLAGFDFTGARLTGCIFDTAKISGAIFDDEVMASDFLESAADWGQAYDSWSASAPNRRLERSATTGGITATRGGFASQGGLAADAGHSGEHRLLNARPVRTLNDARILMYSHDTFGLGHLRRCRNIAHALVEDYRGLNILIISGATIAGAFDYLARVDFVKIPSVIKLRNGEYTSMASDIDLQDTLKMREAIIRHTAETFQPDIFIVDKEPLGLRGEVEDTLVYLKARGTTLVLGLREIMDAPYLLDAEWKRNDIMQKIDKHYDSIWVYGPPDFYDPLVGLDVPANVRRKMDFVGFLQRSASKSKKFMNTPKDDYLLVTTGGGGDGSDLVCDVMNAYEQDPTLQLKALVVLGPYMPAAERTKLLEKGEKIAAIEVIEFDNHMEELIEGASAVVAMGGYSTYCEILSFDKPALIVPRVRPREEQLLRAQRASELGFVDMLLPEQSADPAIMAAALKRLPSRPPPSKSAVNMQHEGLDHISRTIGDWLDRKDRAISVAGA